MSNLFIVCTSDIKIYGIRTGLHAYHIIRWGTIRGQIRVFYTILIKSFGVVKKSQSKNAKNDEVSDL